MDYSKTNLTCSKIFLLDLTKCLSHKILSFTESLFSSGSVVIFFTIMSDGWTPNHLIAGVTKFSEQELMF